MTKNILRWINFTNLKTPDGYIAKSKPQRVCLQLSQTPRGDYAIWPSFYFSPTRHTSPSTSSISVRIPPPFLSIFFFLFFFFTLTLSPSRLSVIVYFFVCFFSWLYSFAFFFFYCFYVCFIFCNSMFWFIIACDFLILLNTVIFYSK